MKSLSVKNRSLTQLLSHEPAVHLPAHVRHSSPRRFLLLAGICLLAVCLRLYQLAPLNVWFDEGIAVNAASQPNLLAVITADPTNPPLYYLLLHLGIRLFGDSELALRWCSVLIGLLAVPLSYQLGRALFNAEAGIGSALLVAISPPLWWASREVRMYGLMAVLMCLLAIAWWRLVNKPERRWWALLWAAELALLYSHTTGPIAALWLNVVTPLVWLTQRQVRRPNLRTWFLGQAALLICYAPWLLTRFVLVPGANQVVAAPPSLSLEVLGQVWQGLWSGAWEMVSHERLLAGFAAVAFLCTVLIIPWRTRAARWFVLHILVLIVSLLAGLIIVRIGLHGRYLVMIVPLLIVLLAGGLSRLQVRTAITVLAAAPFIGLSAYSIAIAANNPAYQHDGVREMVSYYAKTLSTDDTVLAWSYADRYELAYYWPKQGVQAKRVTLPEGQDLGAIAPLLPQRGRVALNVWFTQRADQRRMLSCLLAGGRVNPPDIYTVYGMSNELYAGAQASLPQMRTMLGRFSIANLSAVAQFPSQTADQALCLPVQIVTTHTTERDLKVVIIAKNVLGWEVARADAVFARADQKTSSQLGIGEVLTAYPLLWLPYGTPPGEYTLVARIYDEGELSGYDVLSDGDNPAGKDMPLGKWMVRPGADWARTRRSTNLVQTNVKAGQSLTLQAVSHAISEPITITNGGVDQLVYLWQGKATLPTLILAADDGAWQVDVPPLPGARDPITLDWRQLRVPAEAKAGSATLRLPDGQVLGHYAVTELPGLFASPAVSVTVHAQLPGIGELLGVSLSSTTLDRSQPISVTLIWHAGDTPPATSYTAFVQLIDQNGKLIAQSDALPAGGLHPTTSWRPGEYIVDVHVLTFRPQANAGIAQLIAGLYDADTSQRVRFSDGRDAAILIQKMDIK